MPVGRAVAKLAVPTVISQIVVILYSLADTFFVGQIGAPNQLAALKIPCCDSELIEKIAIETGFAKEYVERFGEYAVSDSLYDNALAGRTYDGKSDADKLWLAQKVARSEGRYNAACEGRLMRDSRQVRGFHLARYRRLPFGFHSRVRREAR